MIGLQSTDGTINGSAMQMLGARVQLDVPDVTGQWSARYRSTVRACEYADRTVLLMAVPYKSCLRSVGADERVVASNSPVQRVR